jgi:hypothetical protein
MLLHINETFICCIVRKGTKITLNLFLERYSNWRKNNWTIPLLDLIHEPFFVLLLHWLSRQQTELKLHSLLLEHYSLWKKGREKNFHKFQYLDFIHPLHLFFITKKWELKITSSLILEHHSKYEKRKQHLKKFYI